MINFFEVKCKYVKQLEDGRLKRVTEPYLIQTETFGDAESQAFELVGEDVQGEFLVTAIKRENFTDIFFYQDSDVWYSAVLEYESMDDSGSTKKVKHNMLVTAGSVKEAYNRFMESLAEMTVQYVIKSVKETPIVDIFMVKENLDVEISREVVSN